MYKISSLGGGGEILLNGGSYFCPKRNGHGEIVPQSEIHPLQIQMIVKIRSQLIEGIFNDKINFVTIEELQQISDFVKIIVKFYLLRDSLKYSPENEKSETFSLLNEIAKEIRYILQICNPQFDLEKYLEKFNIEKVILENRKILGSDLRDYNSISDAEIELNANLLKISSIGRAFTVRLAAELSLALKKAYEPNLCCTYYNGLVRQLGILDDHIGTKKGTLDLRKET